MAGGRADWDGCGREDRCLVGHGDVAVYGGVVNDLMFEVRAVSLSAEVVVRYSEAG